MLKWRTVAAVLTALVVISAGCSDGTETSTTTSVSPADDIVIGEGVMPETMPAGFPLPSGSAIGATMVVTSSGFTEVAVRIGAETGITAEFFNQGLVQAGFSIDRSEGENSTWEIEFSNDSAKGTIDISQPVGGISQALVRYNVP